MKTILQAVHLHKTFGTKGNEYPALQGIDLDIIEGEFVGIMGPSGAGKSTLLNILSTIDTPTSGELTIDGRNIVSMSEAALSDFRRNKLGFIFQDYNLLDTLTVQENIVLPLALSKVPPAEIKARVAKIADVFGIGHVLGQYPHQISGGQKQRTAASRAMVTQPRLILADEPTGALDSKSATGLLGRLQELNQSEQSTIMMVTHDAYAASYCKRVLFINDGLLVGELRKGQGTRKEFFQRILEVLASFGGGYHDVV